jgi:formate dehydrogenase major subunit
MLSDGEFSRIEMASSSSDRAVYADPPVGFVPQSDAIVSVSLETVLTMPTWPPTTIVRPTSDGGKAFGARAGGTPWSDRKKYMFWNPDKKAWDGPDIIDFLATKPPDDKAKPGGVAFDAMDGTSPFIMRPNGLAMLYVPLGFVDGPLPTHYEPAESPVHNPIYPKQDNSPVLKYWKRDDNQLAGIANDKYPHVLTTYRLTEHHLSGVMSRWLPWLAELQPELFTEISPELAKQIGVNNTDVVKISTPRGAITAKALVTSRMRPMQIDGKTVHHVGLPWHFGYQGVVTGAVTNDLTALVGDPNVSIHEGKAFVCALEKA